MKCLYAPVSVYYILKPLFCIYFEAMVSFTMNIPIKWSSSYK